MQLKLDEKQIRKGRAVGLPYIGSKKKVSKKIVQLIIQNFGKEKTVYDLFGGGGAITLECIINGLNVVYNDKDNIPMDILIKVLNEDRDFLKTLIMSRDEFFKIREKEDKTTVDYIKLMVNSFGNNFRDYLYSKKNSDVKYSLAREIIERHNCFSGYKQTETYKNNLSKARLECLERLQQLEQIQQLQQVQQLESIQNITKADNLVYFNEDYKFFSNVSNSIIYLDPPYKNTRQKQYNCQLTNYDEFYDFCIKMSKDNIVLISGYEMPKEFECVFEFKTAKSTMQSGQHSSKYEKLFMVR
ncbi:DNA adenine methylase [Peptoniphilus sp. MSJ-1]|uniref:DNA adenine methylase n=1 Tax=Peptoniphilus ovalis TaxID=2841503 RepID=A0ABS6FHS0_9FIRM|nr:DNA adenine methylase [Peptoniphilus ovalis]MBU5669588.1 DNA adenine methylase [Peptoniphilus ovalis]